MKTEIIKDFEKYIESKIKKVKRMVLLLPAGGGVNLTKGFSLKAEPPQPVSSPASNVPEVTKICLPAIQAVPKKL